jgi:hypothetical protein
MLFNNNLNLLVSGSWLHNLGESGEERNKNCKVEWIIETKMWVCGGWIAGIVGFNRAEHVDVGLFCLLCCVRSDLCDKLIAHSEDC